MLKKVTIASVLLVIIIASAFYFLQSRNGVATTVDRANNKPLFIKETPEEAVRKVATAYWEAAKYKDYANEYGFLSEEDKKLISKEEFVRRQSTDDIIVINNVKIDSITIDSDRASVRVLIDGNTGVYPGTTTFILVDGKWYKELNQGNKEFLGIIK